MKIVCISDTHLQHNFKVPDGDVLVHAGDGTRMGKHHEIWDWAGWMGGLPHKHKIAIAGNHDWGFQKDPFVSRELMQRHGITYLQDSGVMIDGVKFWGSPWQPEFCGWAFNLSRFEGDLTRVWEQIPDDTNVLVTHGPPKNILDLTGDKYHAAENVGCWDLRERVRKLKALKLHVFGHIHTSYGQELADGVKFVNASTCDENYDPVNPPIVVDASAWCGHDPNKETR